MYRVFRVLACVIFFLSAFVFVFNRQVCAGDNIDIGLIIVGEFGDMSFWDTALDGLNRLDDEGVHTRLYECHSNPAAYESVIGKAMNDCDLLFVAGPEFDCFIDSLAQGKPDSDIVCLDFEHSGSPNVSSVAFHEEEGSFLAGILAGIMTSRTDVRSTASDREIVGFVGGYDVPVIRRYLTGFRQGVWHVNPEATVLVDYVDSWTSFSAGRDAALKQYRAGADIIFHAAGGSGLGVIQAGRQSGRYVIGADSEQEKFARGVVLASVVKRLDDVIYSMACSYIDGTYKRGVTYRQGLAEGAIGLSYWTEEAKLAIPPDVISTIVEAEKEIKSGKIIVAKETE